MQHKTPILRITQYLLLTTFLVIKTINACPQSDSLATGKRLLPLFFAGMGGGLGSKGTLLGLSLNLSGQHHHYGASISFRTSMTKSNNVPTDYYDDWRTFTPKDYLSFITLNLVEEVHAPSSSSWRFGFEGGPAWVRKSVAMFELNPNYNPDGFWSYRYFKSHTGSSTLGFSIRTKLDFVPTEVLGFEMALYANINKFQTIAGLELYIIFGVVKWE
jgi:hypothetical protein